MTDMDMPLPEPAHTQVETYSGIALNKVVETPLFTADQLHARDAQWRAIVAAEVAKERERMMPLIDEAILDAAGAALAGAGYDGDAIEKIAPRVLEMWRGFKSAAAIRSAAPPQCTDQPSEPQ